MVYYIAYSDQVHMSWVAVLMTPVFLFIMALMGLGFGIIISSLTTKYRDLTHFLGFGIQLLMYLTPVIYPSSFWRKYEWIIKLNPLASIFENFRHFYIGSGSFDPVGLAYSAAFAIFIFFVGAILFNKIEKTFMDTV
jgi:lipopolysaccharide transport system permease protein